MLIESHFRGMGIGFRAMASALPSDEAFEFARQWLTAARNRAQFTERLKYFVSLRNPGTVALIEDWWVDAEPNTPVTDDWGALAAASQIDWPTLRRWLEGGRPLSLVALAALSEYASKGLPPQFTRPDAAEFTETLEACQTKDRAPRISTAVARVLAATSKLAAGQS